MRSERSLKCLPRRGLFIQRLMKTTLVSLFECLEVTNAVGVILILFRKSVQIIIYRNYYITGIIKFVIELQKGSVS